MDRISALLGTALSFALVTGPAFAGAPPVAVPEPATMTLVALGVGGAILAKKFGGRK